MSQSRALLTDKFRVLLAENFRSRVQLGESLATQFPIDLYLFFARSDTWTGATPDPIDNQEQAFNIYDQMLGLKKIESSSIRGVIRNNTWVSGRQYDVYRHDYGSEYATNELVRGINSEIKLYETDFYVVTSEFKVYKCLDNNNRGISTKEPTSISSAPFKEDDGYVWKYMYSINASDFEKFKTDDYVPIPQTVDSNNAIEPSANFGGAVYNVEIEAKGSNYDIDDLFDVKGDGQDAQVQVTSVGSVGEINSVRVINPGQSYTFGELVPVAGSNSGNNAQLQAIFSPKEGIAKDIALELGAYRLALNAKFGANDFPFRNDFSVVGLLYNPTISSSSSDSAIATYRMELNGPLNPSPAADASILGSNGATGKVIEYGQINNAGPYYIWYTQENVFQQGLTSSNEKIAFVPSSTISGSGSGTSFSGTISSNSDAIKVPEITRGSGQIIYIDNRPAVTRADDQSEDFKIILEF